jgi:hypothetical protein
MRNLKVGYFYSNTAIVPLTSHQVIKPVAWGWFLPGANLRVENHYMDAKPDNGTRLDTVVCGFFLSFFAQADECCGQSFPFNT